MFTGCTGSFNLTRKVYNFHRSQDDKWADELLFLGTIFLPIYGISTFADAVIFNSIEFWTGDNPVDMVEVDNNMKFVKEGSSEATISFNQENQQITIDAQTAQGDSTVIIEKNEGLVRALDKDGNLLYVSTRDGNGQVSVYDGGLELVKNYSPREIKAFEEKFLK